MAVLSMIVEYSPVILSMIAVSLTAMDDNLLAAKKGEAANHIR